MRERALRRGITLEQSIDPHVGKIRGDERKVKQVLLNLLSNAIKFTPEGGRIETRAVLQNTVVQASVRDTGVGIAPEDQEAVFEDFQQVGMAGSAWRCHESSSSCTAAESGSRVRLVWARRLRSRSQCAVAHRPVLRG